MDKATQGVIVVNLGSSITSNVLPSDTVNLLLEVFSKLELLVVWRWDANIENLPANVFTMPWLPLQDLLAHRNTKLLLGHGISRPCIGLLIQKFEYFFTLQVVWPA